MITKTKCNYELGSLNKTSLAHVELVYARRAFRLIYTR